MIVSSLSRLPAPFGQGGEDALVERDQMWTVFNGEKPLNATAA
jgi:hypothetical protein